MIKQGVINLLKPAGMTSHDAVSTLRRLTGIKRIGHTGTLDPMAAGVLPLGIGSAARMTEYLDLDEKTYRCEMLLGLSTDTQDIWGAVISDQRGDVSGLREGDILSAFEPLKGNIMQLPPQYSALKVDGKRLYEYARKGETVEIPKRPVSVSNLSVTDIDLKRGRVCFDVTCSKGTYIRTFCHEVGQTLGCGAAMSFLLRTGSGGARLEDTVTVEELCRAKDEIWNSVKSVDSYLTSLGKLALRAGRGKWFSNGGYLTDRDVTVIRPPYWEERQKDERAFNERVSHLGTGEKLLNCYLVYEEDQFLGTAVYDKEQKKYVCDKVFDR